MPGALTRYTPVKINIPASTFVFGDMSVGGVDRKRPVDGFAIGKFPVTNEQWMRFETQTGHTGREDYGERFSGPRQPVVGVSLEDALAFCAWAGLRLPTEVEWERAARGTDGRRYTWGSSYPNPKYGNYGSSLFDDSRPRTTPVGSFPEGVSPAGCYDMAGNVDEWCMNPDTQSGDRLPIRGANWLSATWYAV